MTPLAFVVVTVAGAGPGRQDIVELAAARVDPDEAAPEQVFSARVRPWCREDAETLDGLSALALDDAIDRLRETTRGCALAAYDVAFTRHALEACCAAADLEPLALEPRSVDVGSLAWPLVRSGEARADDLAAVCDALGIRIAGPASAIGELRAVLDVYRHLTHRFARVPTTTRGFSDDEQSIIDTIASRIADGRRTYGPWRVDDGRNNPREALAEVMDALNYCAAELVRLSKGGAS